MSYQTSIIIWGKWLFDQNIPNNCRILHLKEFYIFLKKVNNDARSLFNCSSKNKTNKQKISTMGHKTQNGDLIISYSKFVNLKFMDQSQSLLGWFSEIFTNFLILLIFFQFLFVNSLKKKKTNMSIELLVKIFYGLKPLTIFFEKLHLTCLTGFILNTSPQASKCFSKTSFSFFRFHANGENVNDTNLTTTYVRYMQY